MHHGTRPSRVRRALAAVAAAVTVLLTVAACETQEARHTLELINQHRAAAGCSALTTNEQLTNAANRHAKDMRDNNVRDHTGSDGSTPDSRIADAGYSPASATGEILYWADQESSYQQAVDWWMNSESHRAIIEDCRFTHIGLGILYPGNTRYFSVGVFGAR